MEGREVVDGGEAELKYVVCGGDGWEVDGGGGDVGVRWTKYNDVEHLLWR